MQTSELRKLIDQADDMLVRAKVLYGEAERLDGPEKERAEKEASAWVQKAKEIALIVSSLAKAS
ncbi:hypothetical protein [Prosthecomicrobium pneumaticum]|uniref:Uncharacterized protein n=1 Tax=Prosthecomicrobium pneumaticum TaxID=81895 RepID=A0A7W9L3D4_9HYPH|nr:hypothetical protein [Prosthecomicrobium pneumaticum]MBB5754431.1 hypothetical protein [Prosthecomicrobium pneumaticum]